MIYKDYFTPSTVIEENHLEHHGVLGMKWGVRRYQNADGSLTAKGKVRVSKEYKKAAIKGNEALRKNYNKMYFDSYNKAADKMNNGEIDKFNKAQEKKYGKDFANREGYTDDYMDIFDKEFSNFMNQTLLDFYESNESYKKGQDLVKQYGMEKWDDLVKTNEAGIRELRSQLKKARG